MVRMEPAESISMVEPLPKPSLEFQVRDPRALQKSLVVVGKLTDDGCFEYKDDNVVLERIDPSHVALAKLILSRHDLLEFREGENLCLSIEKLNKILGRMRREDDSVKFSAKDDKIVIAFPITEREFSIERQDIEPEKLPEPTLQFSAKVKLATKELKAVLKDVEASNNVTLSANGGVELSAEFDGEGYSKRFKSPNLVSSEVTAPAKAAYSQVYLANVITTDFDVATLRWATNYPIEISYEPYPHSRLEFLVAPRLEESNPGHPGPREGDFGTLTENLLADDMTKKGNPGSGMKKSVIVGVATGAVVYSVTKWKQDWVERNLHIAPEYLGIIAGGAGFGVSYFVL